MTYLPELRGSLVRAARPLGEEGHEGEPGRDGAAGAPDARTDDAHARVGARRQPALDPRQPALGLRRRSLGVRRPSLGVRRPSLGPLAALLGAAAAIAILVIALTSVGHRSSSTTDVESRPPTVPAARQALARAAAMRLLDSVVLPRGALQVSADPSSPPRFGRPESTLALPHVVDVRRFWRLPGTVTSAANWFQSHPPAGGRLMSSEAAGTGRARSGRPRLSILTMWGGTYTFASAPPGLTAQQLTIALAPARGGGVAVRADGQAGWLPPRPVAEQIPDTVTRIGVAYITRTDLRSRGSASTSSTETRLETFDLTSRDRIRQMVSALNVLPHAARSVQPCSRRRGTEIALVFYGIDRRTRLASARILPNCTALVLAINGRPPQTLSLAAPAVGPPLLAILKPPLTSTTTTSTSSATSTSPASTTASSTSTASTTSTTSR